MCLEDTSTYCLFTDVMAERISSSLNWLCSWEFAAALRDSKPKFDAAGFKLITIGVGPPSKAQVLAEKVVFVLDSHYYSDVLRWSLTYVVMLVLFGHSSANSLDSKCNFLWSFYFLIVISVCGLWQLPFPSECLYADPDHKVCYPLNWNLFSKISLSLLLIRIHMHCSNMPFLHSLVANRC